MMVLLFMLLGLSVLGLVLMSVRCARLSVEKTRLQADLENERKNSAEKTVLFKTEFENLANRIFEEKGGAMVRQNQARLSDVLAPLEKQIQSFQDRVNTVHTENVKQSSALLEQVRQLQEFSNKVSEDANNLASAIKGSSKTQGDWGELIVERILESSGLCEGREYERQKSFRDENQTLKRPDFVVHLPGQKSVVLDSKVSLTAFERFSNASDEEEKKRALSEHLSSVRRHIQDLEGKEYSQLPGGRALDFVILCVPLESAYQTALQHDPDLLYDVAKTRVVLTGPATLLITLKLIAQIWRRENEQRNATEIAEQAGRMYDQVRLVFESAQDARKRLDSAGESLDLVLKRLQTGKGSLIGRVEKLRLLGAKVKETLPHEAVETAAEEEESAD